MMRIRFGGFRSIIPNAWNFVDTAPTDCITSEGGTGCFRRGLDAYPNGGLHDLYGKLTFSGRGGTIYRARVMIPQHVEPSVGYDLQSNMINGGINQDQYITKSAGVQRCDGPDWAPCQMYISAHWINCIANGSAGTNGSFNGGLFGPQACEIRVQVYPETQAGFVNYVLGKYQADPNTGQGEAQGGVSDFYLSQIQGH
jgi:hypothetical protein